MVTNQEVLELLDADLVRAADVGRVRLHSSLITWGFLDSTASIDYLSQIADIVVLIATKTNSGILLCPALVERSRSISPKICCSASIWGQGGEQLCTLNPKP